jgi:hypothetical protein
MPRLIVLTLFAAFAVACVAERPLENKPCPCAVGWTCDLTRQVCVASDSGGQQDLGMCGAICGTPAGAVVTPTSVEDAYAMLEGSWLVCGKWGGGSPGDVIGVEFGPASSEATAGGSTVGGLFYLLVLGPSGPQRGSGFAYQANYDLSPEGGSYYQLNIHPAPNSGYGGSFRYSPCPRELELQVNYDAPLVLVPIGGS